MIKASAEGPQIEQNLKKEHVSNIVCELFEYSLRSRFSSGNVESFVVTVI